MAEKDKMRYQREYAEYVKTPEYAHYQANKDVEVKPKRAKKDPNAPKNALSPFMIYSMKVRPDIVAKYPEAKFGEIGRIIGAQWREIDADQKLVSRVTLFDREPSYHVVTAEI